MLSQSIYQQLIAPFADEIKPLKKLYIAPDGFLHLLSFAALRLPNGRYWTEHQQINRLQSSRDMIANEIRPDKPAPLFVAMGGVDYAQSDPKQSAEIKSSVFNLNRATADQISEIKYLKHSRDEARELVEIYKRSRIEDEAVLLEGQQATEHYLKNMKTAPRVLHLSTHGFYLDENKSKKIAQSWPMLLSGLTLAGANHGLNGKLNANQEDGLLYALEVLGLNLQGTELVSLSACNTGKGVVDYSEGVYGLVRAFRTAGARSVLMTLRPVGDEAAKDFMIHFYDTWLSSKEGIGADEALHRTRLHFINHPEKPEYRDPSVWSPYVLVGRP